MLSAFARARSVCFASASFLICVTSLPALSRAQSGAASASQTLPPIVVQADRPRATGRRVAPRQPIQPAPVISATDADRLAGQGSGQGSLTVATARQAQREINRTPGGVALVTADSYRNTSVSNTIKDVLDYVPGVFVQPKWGDDTRLSIRGSGLSRNFHLRGVQLYMDGIPISTADGYGDFQEIDPTAYRYVEVYKGGNALRFGANSLGGAINFVTPSGRDIWANGVSTDLGAFGYRRLQANAGGVSGAWDGFVTASTQAAEGFRQHSEGRAERISGNVGYQFSPDAETRFYLNANEVRQRIPGTVSRSAALNAPENAALGNLALDQQRNIDTVRIANKTTLRFDATTVELGLFALDRHLMHPIFQWLDYRYADYGGFARVTDDRIIGGFRNRLIAGVNIHNGKIDNRQFANLAGSKGALLSSSIDRSTNTSLYLENALYVLPSVAAIAGTQFLDATRRRQDRFLSNGDQSGATAFRLWSPKGGLLWDIDPTWQAFANVSRSAEVPSFGESSSFPAPVIPWTAIRPQRATTYEIGTRGKRPDLAWELTAYRAQIKDELLCLYSAFGNCNVTNADRSIHQGLEAGLGAAVLKNVFVAGTRPDKIWINLAYTLNDFRFDRDPLYGNNGLPGAPRHFLRAEALYKHPTGLYAGPNVECVPQAYFVDSANTQKTQAYAIFGLKAGFDDGGPVTGYIEARNLANKAYIASASIIDKATATSTLFEPGTGRAVYAGARYRW